MATPPISRQTLHFDLPLFLAEIFRPPPISINFEKCEPPFMKGGFKLCVHVSACDTLRYFTETVTLRTFSKSILSHNFLLAVVFV